MIGLPTLVTSLVILPFIAGPLLLFARKNPQVLRIGIVLTTALNLTLSLSLLMQTLQWEKPFELVFGDWKAPVGITFHIDGLSAIMVSVSSFVGFCGALFACGEIGRSLWLRNYAFFFLLLLAGINGAFLTGDLFNLFVWFEVMLIASFAMMILGRRKHTYEGATKYVVINMVSSFFFISGLGVLYGKTGSLNLVDVSLRLAGANSDPLILTSAALMLIAFGIKAGIFPLYFWLPASYPHTGFTTAAVFGGLLTKVGVYSLFRVFGGAFQSTSDFTAGLFLVIGGATMVAGVLGAASQYHVRRILSFHIISQIGYLILGLGLFTQGAFAAAIFYTVHHILVKTNLFFAAGLISRSAGTEELKEIGGLLNQKPFLAILFLIPALSLGGIPPLSGFFAKFLLIREALLVEAWFWAALALLVGIVTLFSMTKIWAEAFWKDHPNPQPAGQIPAIQFVPVILLATGTIAIGIFVQPLFDVATHAAEQLLPVGNPTTATAYQP